MQKGRRFLIQLLKKRFSAVLRYCNPRAATISDWSGRKHNNTKFRELHGKGCKCEDVTSS